jgi:hypothetical protein
MKRQLVTLLLVCGIALVAATATAFAKGDPQGPRKQQWLCVLDQRNWHCIPPGEDIEAVLTGQAASAPSVNYGCEASDDPLCDGFAVSLTGPPAGTVFVGTENGIRADLYAGQPCPRDDAAAPIDFTGDGVPDYVFCHHYFG